MNIGRENISLREMQRTLDLYYTSNDLETLLEKAVNYFRINNLRFMYVKTRNSFSEVDILNTFKFDFWKVLTASKLLTFKQIYDQAVELTRKELVSGYEESVIL